VGEGPSYLNGLALCVECARAAHLVAVAVRGLDDGRACRRVTGIAKKPGSQQEDVISSENTVPSFVPLSIENGREW
jgi:hypothetical protein